MNPVAILIFVGTVLYSVDMATCGLSAVSIGKPAFQTSTFGDAEASLATDGNGNSNFYDGHCSHTEENTENPTWYVDLGETYLIHQLIIYNRRDCCSERLNPFNVHIGDSDDVLTNPQCGGDHNIGLSDSTISVSCPGMWGRYVAVTLPGSSRTLTLCEVIVMAYTCPSGFNNRWDRNTCLRGFLARKTYSGAKTHCSDYSAQLYAVDNADDTQRLKGLMTTYSARGKRGVWVGLTDSDTEGSFKWDIGMGVPLGAYTDWAAKALDKNTADRNCVQMKASKNWQWWVVDCEDKNAFICAKDLKPASDLRYKYVSET